MFNIFEGNADAKALKLQERLEILKRAREDGFFDEEPIIPIPEIVADGHGPDDGWLREPNPEPPKPYGSVRSPNSGGNVAAPTPMHKYYTSQPCSMCLTHTRHISYGRGSPTWHCVVCCTCDWCLAVLKEQFKQARGTPDEVTEEDFNRVREQFARAERKLYDAVADDVNYFYCTKCGAALRCGVCDGHGTGNYCDLCGRKDTGEGFCTDCWKGENTNG